jgi:hypothetical protein
MQRRSPADRYLLQLQVVVLDGIGLDFQPWVTRAHIRDADCHWDGYALAHGDFELLLQI